MELEKIKTVTKACEYGYFSESTLKRNKVKYDPAKDEFIRVYAGLLKKHIYVYKNDEAFELYKRKELRWN